MHQLMIIRRLHMSNFKSLSHLYRFTDSLKTNRGYIAKQLQKVWKNHKLIKTLNLKNVFLEFKTRIPHAKISAFYNKNCDL